MQLRKPSKKSFCIGFKRLGNYDSLKAIGTPLFFHLSTIVKRRFDSIEFLKTGEGWVQGTDMVAKEIVGFYENLFTYEPTDFLEDLDRLIQPVVSEMDNESLCAMPLEEEVRAAVFSMGSYKAPGPDEFSPIFLNIIGM